MSETPPPLSPSPAPRHRTRIKICGITRVEDAQAAASSGADAIGLVFYPPSPRNVSVAQARDIAFSLPPFVSVVALFVNAAPDLVEEVIDQIRPALLQFHGDETPQDCARYRHPYIRAARMREGLDLLDFVSRFSTSQALVLDTDQPGYGGGGEVFDWSRIPANVALPLVLSGGLHAANVTHAIRQVRPWAVDVSSGVEASKGIKSAQRIAEFIAAVRAADL
ncbi:MAG: phosphoribosylanthranilate isomerase [Thiomonas arsenitoxydans]|uniref:N-(5'-phosphoribosyl)anthranilate isomerase n=1 Tax=Thiomonas arsenitoxydans (strain DSM 22701 / CIP 110005 / 3As) TaxID=426114 RepID=A0A8I1MSX0_THIA3|nr:MULTISPECIES: phosphoribosylanthranilate isomerase [Thiomonas]MBN8742833.1 phosphoribosylanthranilate isomerase [Thiomonas arsenitoxydans]ODU97938.1 MAG: N-(5'-phosphoribosyl)anthranilate isomerase [Thiomonas sp. SCN 64-16]